MLEHPTSASVQSAALFPHVLTYNGPEVCHLLFLPCSDSALDLHPFVNMIAVVHALRCHGACSLCNPGVPSERGLAGSPGPSCSWHCAHLPAAGDQQCPLVSPRSAEPSGCCTGDVVIFIRCSVSTVHLKVLQVDKHCSPGSKRPYEPRSQSSNFGMQGICQVGLRTVRALPCCSSPAGKPSTR